MAGEHDVTCDVIIVGGGLGGSALAMSLARQGIQVLVLERDTVFRDRVRGEYVHPWGVTEARALGLYDLLKDTCGYETRFRINHVVGLPSPRPRDMVATSPHRVGSLHFYHPEMQEVVLRAAADAGACVQRGVTVLEVLPGAEPCVRVRTAGGEQVRRARLVVAADGRTSPSRKSAGFAVRRDPERLVIAGALLENLDAPEDLVCYFANPEVSQYAFTIPLGRRRFRCYAGFYQQPGRHRLTGDRAVGEFIAGCITAGAPAAWFSGAQAAGPLASFSCADTWVEHPYRAGVALIGDAAAASDPSFGCGLGLTLRDVRVLSDLLLSGDEWDAAAHAYASAHDGYFASIHRQLDWLVRLYYEPGPAAAARRARAFARLAQDPRRAPDIPGLGPESRSDDDAYRNLFGEEPEDGRAGLYTGLTE